MTGGIKSSRISALKNHKGVRIPSRDVGEVRQLNSQKLSPSVENHFFFSPFCVNHDCFWF